MSNASREQVSDHGSARWEALLARITHSSASALVSVCATGDPRSTPGADGVIETAALVRAVLEAGARATRCLPAAPSGVPATTEDTLAEALALTVAMVRDSARHIRESALRERWAAASACASVQLFYGGGQRPLDQLTDRAAEAAEADFGTLTLLSDSGVLRVRAVTGSLAADLTAGTSPHPVHSLAARVVRAGKALLAEAYPEARAIGPVAMVPLRWGDRVTGALAVGRTPGGPPFTPVDLRHLGAFAGQVAGAIEFAWSSAAHDQSEHRDEVDTAVAALTDAVVGDLFAVGLGLRNLIGTGTPPAHRERLTEHIDSLTATASRVRDFFAAEFPRRRHPVPLSLRLLATADAAELVIDTPVRVALADNITRMCPPGLADDIIAVARDALTTVAHARLVELCVDFDGDTFAVAVQDDGAPTVARSRLVAVLRDLSDGSRSVRQTRGVDGTRVFVWTARLP
ncbi:GAF domain-containing protein [Actinokineospora auranticolor]|uniref:GAF domain-containing protein n=1 Tax=Actinokineospora auranticolor TaxID=155976 RepID=A0A2S6GIV3_9PSEU|nr:GAF domain-containing protein [Actinokineospora auranticolor]PPK65164.1 GAF domain-containing protein [Actinokineospora auranticolor]